MAQHTGAHPAAPTPDHRAAMAAAQAKVDGLLEALRAAGPLPDLGEALRRLHTSADEIRALVAEPVRLALIGRYSSGKSRLIGTLLGNPALLPSEWDPTTGNVTVLRLRAADVGTAIRSGTQVWFLTEDDLRQCITSMAGSVAAMVRGLAVPGGPDPAALEAADPGDTAALRAFLERAWRLDISPLRTRLAELNRLLGAYENGRDLLGATFVVDDEILREVSAIQRRKDAEESAVLPAIPVRKVRRGDRLTAETAEAVFDLIDHIEITVDVPHGSWGATLLGDGGLIYDFPGAGNNETGLRDRYLARRDLRHVTVSLVAVDASLPHDHAPFQMIEDFYVGGQATQSRRDHGRLACGTKADLLHGDVKWLAQAARPLTSAVLESRAAHLAAVVQQCRRASPGGRAAETLLVSAHYHREPPGGDDYAAAAAVLREDLPSHEELATALAALAEDGGVGRLREVIGRHVTKYGLVLAAEKVGRQVAGAAVAARDIAERLAAADRRKASPQGQLATRELLRLSEKLRTEYTRLQRAVEAEMSDLHRRPYGDGRTLVEITEAAVARMVSDWPEWEPLYASVRGGVVVPEEGGPDLPATTVPFRERFLDAHDELGGVIGAIARDVVAAWRRGQTERMAELRASLARTAADHPELAGPLARLAPYAELPWVADVEPVASDGGGLDPAARFPLRDSYMLPWHADASFTRAETRGAMRHQIHVRRLHRELTAALLDVATDRLADTLRSTAAQIKAELSRRRFPTPAELRSAPPREAAGERRSPYADLIDKLRSFE
ncbi:hypothetical protein [Sinosporangium siamense]|uniref:Dynamin family protein n=1 Tax=Sinosporangium siamense TaxID=1367973 RepID=A0A919RF69_9ACTN|nr:hypothetical protein [Sinosporangium siamense]GII90654.1 hypothetical protein Ssi02_08850 [Sinosporangium siamense]